MSYSLVGAAQVGGNGYGNFTVTTAGNLIVVAVFSAGTGTNGSFSSPLLTGGGVTWTHIASYFQFDSTSGYNGVELFGACPPVGAGSLTVNNTFSPLLSGFPVAQEVSLPTPGVWSIDNGNYSTFTATGSGSFPSLTASGAGRLWVGGLGVYRNYSGSYYLGISQSGPATTLYATPSTVKNQGFIFAVDTLPGTSAYSPTWSGYNYLVEGSIGAAMLYSPPASSNPTRPVTSRVPVQRAANWFKRASGLWSPESGLIPRAA